ncbi:hypothetical protein CBR_g22250 [Chara braunii]|uniref:60S ribosomal export protein NMD3 n=1 Tax=Chara braunii TaxID=69332 RepID=A0A388L2N8_CHABU|nr:hypothetical protein CBR_g22250 [Chara braunii]|eukprot:GBG76502.1 hypothetical protein CBR_g22250 [Chara braunii]
MAAMEMFHVQQTPGVVLCCLCGTAISPNPTNMCMSCIRTQVDITEGLQKQLTIFYCRNCGRYLQPPRAWIKAELESKELLTFCIKRMKNLSKVKLVDAGFVWTEPHSKRLKVKLTVQKEVFNDAILQQTFVADYVVEDNMCDSCSRAAGNPDQWVAVVQLRQKVDHKRTFFFLEQLILKHGADANTVNVKKMHEGLDFYYGHRSHALKFVDFVNSVVPVRHRNDKQLVSHDTKSNHYNYRFTFSVEICPICKDDLICLPQRLSTSLGNLGPLVLCTRVSNSLFLLDPATLRTSFVDAQQYWRAGYKPLLTSRQLVEYVVLDIEVIGGGAHSNNDSAGAGGGGRYLLAEAQVARKSDFGQNDLIFTTRTHLGRLLSPGDYALGYDLYGANTNSDELDSLKSANLPDVILVRKSYEEKRRRIRGKPRPWKLRNLAMEVDATAVSGRGEEEQQQRDYERFLEELEEDPEMRSRIALFKNPQYTKVETASMAGDDGEEPPQVPLEELLSELRIADQEGGDGDGVGSDGPEEMDM